MAEFKEVSTRDLSFNVFQTVANEWAVVTVQDEGKVNGMTVSWFQMGHMWRDDVVTVYVRPQRHTYPLINRADTFSLCFFEQTPEAKKQMSYLGSASGKEHDKLAECGCTAGYDDLTPYIEQAKWAFICEIIYEQDIDPTGFRDKAIVEKEYAPQDFHRMYVGRIKKVLVRE